MKTRSHNTLELFLFDKKPGKGSISFQKNTKKEIVSKKREFEEAKRLLREYGGNYVILSETKIQGQSMPDIVRNGRECFEVKNPSTATAIDSRLRDGILQMLESRCSYLKGKKKYLVLSTTGKARKISVRKVTEIIDKRTSLTKENDLDAIIVRLDSEKVIYNQKTPPHRAI